MNFSAAQILKLAAVKTYDQLTWSLDSPDVGDPTCVCSACGERIPASVTEIRLWRFITGGGTNSMGGSMEEAVLHPECHQYLTSIKTFSEN